MMVIGGDEAVERLERPDIHSITIIGGTGTLGKAILKTVSEELPKVHVTIVSRDEHKQAMLKREFPIAEFAIADIREERALIPHVAGRDVVFHVAAMKHVDIIERNPEEAYKTNVLGTMNVAQACIGGGVKHMVFSSTDKAVDPINAYGYSKAMAEKYLFNQNKIGSRTSFSVYRWGNVLGSQGSAIPFFVDTLKREGRAYITHMAMTRFWIPIDWAVRYMLHTYHEASRTEAMVPPMIKAAPVSHVITALADLTGVKDFGFVTTGMRPGEKIHEAMYSMHASSHPVTSETCAQYSTDELKELLLPFAG